MLALHRMRARFSVMARCASDHGSKSGSVPCWYSASFFNRSAKSIAIPPDKMQPFSRINMSVNLMPMSMSALLIVCLCCTALYTFASFISAASVAIYLKNILLHKLNSRGAILNFHEIKTFGRHVNEHRVCE